MRTDAADADGGAWRLGVRGGKEEGKEVAED